MSLLNRDKSSENPNTPRQNDQFVCSLSKTALLHTLLSCPAPYLIRLLSSNRRAPNHGSSQLSKRPHSLPLQPSNNKDNTDDVSATIRLSNRPRWLREAEALLQQRKGKYVHISNRDSQLGRARCTTDLEQQNALYVHHPQTHQSTPSPRSLLCAHHLFAWALHLLAIPHLQPRPLSQSPIQAHSLKFLTLPSERKSNFKHKTQRSSPSRTTPATTLPPASTRTHPSQLSLPSSATASPLFPLNPVPSPSNSRSLCQPTRAVNSKRNAPVSYAATRAHSRRPSSCWRC